MLFVQCFYVIRSILIIACIIVLILGSKIHICTRSSFSKHGVKIVASFCTFSVEPYRHFNFCAAIVFTEEQRYIVRDISKSKQLYLPSIFPAAGCLVRRFRKFTVNLLNFQNEHNKHKNARPEHKHG